MNLDPPLPTPTIYRPYAGGKYRMALGLREIEPLDWIHLDSDYPREMSLKRQLLADRHDEVFAALDGMEEPATELAHQLSAHLTSHFPAWFTFDGPRFENRLTGERWNLDQPAQHPLEMASRWVQEDLCLMAPEQGVYNLAAASLCFPSRWRLADKLARPMSAIHEDVPRFGEQLGAASDRFMAVLAAGRIVERFNWTIHDSPDHFQPQRSAPCGSEPLTADNAGGRLWVRVERQTLSRLPRTGLICFTIKTRITPLDELSNNPASAADLAEALRGLPEEMKAYRGLIDLAPVCIAWLESVEERHEGTKAQRHEV